jgi:cytochrome d ubiquinol oxidase subunit II
MLIGLVLYAVLAGADFGAALWQLGAGKGMAGSRLRDFAHHAMAPVWEANQAG